MAMLRYCRNCGTEVDETVVFCPTCGQSIDQAAETEAEPEMPPAPAWPEPETQAPPSADPATQEWADPDAGTAADAPPPTADAPPPAAAAAPVQPQEPGAAPPSAAGSQLPFTAPVTLSGWLIGGGAAVGALGALVGLLDGSANLIEILLLVVLLGIAASVFAASVMPAIPHLRLATLVVVLVGFGVALDRIGFGGGGAATLLIFLGTAAAGIGGIILELGRDQPLGGA